MDCMECLLYNDSPLISTSAPLDLHYYHHYHHHPLNNLNQLTSPLDPSSLDPSCGPFQDEQQQLISSVTLTQSQLPDSSTQSPGSHHHDVSSIVTLSDPKQE